MICNIISFLQNGWTRNKASEKKILAIVPYVRSKIGVLHFTLKYNYTFWGNIFVTVKQCVDSHSKMWQF